MKNEEKNIILKAIKDNITASDYDIAKIPEVRKCFGNIKYDENTLAYKNKLSKVLQAGSVTITMIDNQMHWIAVVGYSNRKINFVDSGFKKIKQEISLKDFVKISGNTDKFNKSYFYYLIIISNNV